jgi:hypothetical protein
MASSWESAKVDGSDMPLYLSVPASGGRVPGIVVVHGQSGLENFIKDTTHMLALQGYAAVAPNLTIVMVPTVKTMVRRAKPVCATPRLSTISMLPSDSSRITGRSTADGWASSAFAWAVGWSISCPRPAKI